MNVLASLFYGVAAIVEKRNNRCLSSCNHSAYTGTGQVLNAIAQKLPDAPTIVQLVCKQGKTMRCRKHIARTK
jgi:hypothetical protein